MLGRRLKTALILIAIVGGGLLLTPLAFFPLVSGIFVLIGAWEWAGISGYTHMVERWIYLIWMSILMLLLWYYPHYGEYVLITGFTWWLLAILVLVAYLMDLLSATDRKYKSFLMIGFIVLLSFWVGLGRLRFLNTWHLVALMAIVYSADTGAYIAGKRFGKIRLAARISPGKTLEGLVGGVLAGTLVAVTYAFIIKLSLLNTIFFALFGALIVLISILGDLFESTLKRLQNQKDSSQLLPGHGGLLDRIDSLVAATPVFTLCLPYFLGVH